MKIRKMEFDRQKAEADKGETTQDFYFTCFLNVTSYAFPSGEPFFCDALLYYKDQITDPELKKQVTLFVGQERVHAFAHAKMNDFLVPTFNLDVSLMKGAENDSILARQLPPDHQLAITVAQEHFTSMLARHLLGHPQMVELIHPGYRKLWVQHSIEELEHKAVAFDLFQHLKLSRRIQFKGMFDATYSTARFLFGAAFEVVLASKGRKLEGLLSALKIFFHPSFGLFWSSMALQWVSFFMPWYHPNNKDDSALIKQWMPYIEQDSAKGNAA